MAVKSRYRKSQDSPEFLLGEAVFPGDAYNETFASENLLREHWQSLIRAFNQMGRTSGHGCLKRFWPMCTARRNC